MCLVHRDLEMWQLTQRKSGVRAVCLSVCGLSNVFVLKRKKEHTFLRAHEDVIQKANICFPRQNGFLALPGNNFLKEKYVFLSPATTGNCATARTAFITDLHSIYIFFPLQIRTLSIKFTQYSGKKLYG